MHSKGVAHAGISLILGISELNPDVVCEAVQKAVAKLYKVNLLK